MKEYTSELLSLVERHGGGQTWWMSPFYESFCKLYNLEFNNTQNNVLKIRMELNKLVAEGLVKKRSYGTGYGGRSLFGSTRYTLWLKNTKDENK